MVSFMTRGSTSDSATGKFVENDNSVEIASTSASDPTSMIQSRRRSSSESRLISNNHHNGIHKVESEPGKLRRSTQSDVNGDEVADAEIDSRGDASNNGSDDGPERPRTPSAASSDSELQNNKDDDQAQAGRPGFLSTLDSNTHDRDSGERLRESTITSVSDPEPFASDSVDSSATLPPALDHVLISALQHPRDRILLLRAEVEMERFVSHPTASRLPLSPPHFQPNLNSYQRLLIHRLADVFGITREVEAAPSVTWVAPGTTPPGIVVLVKGPSTRMPSAKLATIVPPPTNSGSSSTAAPPHVIPAIVSSSSELSGHLPPSPAPASPARERSPSPLNSPVPQIQPQIFKILPRSTSARGSSTSSSAGAADDDSNGKSKSRKELTLEEREAAYKEARERIFSQQSDVTRPAPTPTPSTSSLASSSTGSNLADAAPGLTRPSSAGSTYSRGSAAASVAGGRAESTTSSYYSGYQTQGPPSMFYPIPSSASSSSSLMSGSSWAASLRPSAPSFDPNMGWSPDNDPYQQHQQYYYGAGVPPPPPPPPQQPFQNYGPPSDHSQSSAFSQQVNGAPSPVPYPRPSSFLVHPSGPPPSSSSVQADHYAQSTPLTWATPRPSAALPSPALSTGSRGSLGNPNNSGASTSGLREQSYLMRFPDGGVVPYAGSSNSSNNSSQASLHAASHANVGPRSTSSISSAARRSDSGSRRLSNSSLTGSVKSSTASIESGASRTTGRKTLDRDGTLRGKGREEPDHQDSKDETSHPKTLHPSLPAKPEWSNNFNHSDKSRTSTPSSDSSRSSSFPSLVSNQVKPPSGMSTGYTTSSSSSSYQTDPTGVSHSSTSASFHPDPGYGHYQNAIPPPPPHQWYPTNHNYGPAPPYIPQQQVYPGQGPYLASGASVPLAAHGAVPTVNEMRRPPPRSTELFDPSKPSSTSSSSNAGSAPSSGGKGRGRGGGRTSSGETGGFAPSNGTCRGGGIGLEKGVEGLRL